MRSIPTLFIFSLLLVSDECLLIPKGRKVNSGHEYSKEAIAFLDSRGVTRAETIANLGLPSWESTSSRVLLYAWHSSEKWLFLPVDNNLGIHKSVAEAREERWVLLIAYDEQGLVSSHALRRIGKGTLEEACSEWSRTSPGVRPSPGAASHDVRQVSE